MEWVQIGPTAARTGSNRVQGLSWAPTGAELKPPWSCSLWLNADPILQRPVDRHCLGFVVKLDANLWPLQQHSFGMGKTTKKVLRSSGEVWFLFLESLSWTRQWQLLLSLSFSHLPGAAQHYIFNGWLVSDVWLLLTEPQLWEIALLFAPDVLSLEFPPIWRRTWRSGAHKTWLRRSAAPNGVPLR